MALKGIETRVLVLPYEESSIDKGTYLQTCREPIEIISVKNYENSLVEIIFPHGEKVIANAGQLITAIQKCVM